MYYDETYLNFLRDSLLQQIQSYCYVNFLNAGSIPYRLYVSNNRKSDYINSKSSLSIILRRDFGANTITENDTITQIYIPYHFTFDNLSINVTPENYEVIEILLEIPINVNI